MAAAIHLFRYLLNDGGLPLAQTRPHPFVLWLGRRWIIDSPAAGGEQAFVDLLWKSHPRRAAEDGSDRSHSLLVDLLPFGPPRCGWCADRLAPGEFPCHRPPPPGWSRWPVRGRASDEGVKILGGIA